VKSVFCTTANINENSGGGIVSRNELVAVKAVTDVQAVITKTGVLPEAYQAFDIPFLTDYFASIRMEGVEVDLAVFNGSPWGSTAKRLRPAKIIVDVPAHNLEESIEEFHRLGMNYPFRHMTDPFLWSLYTEHIKLADVVICPSKLSAEYIKNKLSLTNKVMVIQHGCILPEKVAPIPQTFTVGHLSQNGPDKGQIYLVKAWQKLRLDARIIIAGAGTEAWGGLGCIPDASLVYGNCSVYVQPSVTEGFGISVLEAMAFGRPVIVTEGAGVYEIVEDGREGFVVPIRSLEKIAEALTYLYENQAEVRRMGRNARIKAEEYEWGKIKKRYEELYASI
jgi:glycosyltransferase involved in cell wall biosynthesis